MRPQFSPAAFAKPLLTSFALVLTGSALAQATWNGRPFTKVLAKGDPIPGVAGASFGVIERFTLRDGKLHIVAGESANRKGIFRWHNGTLTKLVYTDTPSPTGGNFDTVHFVTDETEGALNFVGEIFFGRPGFVYGLFEWKDGVITRIFDTASPVDDRSLMGFGYPVRVGHQVVGGAQFMAAGETKTGILRWDGAHLQTVVESGNDLPGSLGGFTGTPGRYQIAFDGTDVAFVASAHPQGKGPYGVYRTTAGGSLTKLVDGNDPYPWGGTYADSGLEFVNVDLDGPHSFVGVGDAVSAAGTGNSFYTSSLRISNGTLNASQAPWGFDGSQAEVLPYYEPGTQNRARIDGKVWTGIRQVDGHGDDVAFHLTFDDFSEGIYAAIGASTPTPKAPVLTPPVAAAGKITLRFESIAGQTYRIEFQSSLSALEWTPRGNLSGTGGTLEFQDDIAGAGFYRVSVVP